MLNAAFEVLSWRFRLDGVVQVPAAALANITGSPVTGSGCTSADEAEYDEGGSADCGSGSGSSGGGDAVVEQCLQRWAQLERVLLPPLAGNAAGTSSRGTTTTSSSNGGSSGGGGGQPDPPAIHVVVCEPQGVNGAALVLGDAAAGQQGEEEGGSSEGVPSGGTILLRRGALWQSRTSLVHQVGSCLLLHCRRGLWTLFAAAHVWLLPINHARHAVGLPISLHLAAASPPPHHCRSWGTTLGCRTPSQMTKPPARWTATAWPTRRSSMLPTRAARWKVCSAGRVATCACFVLIGPCRHSAGMARWLAWLAARPADLPGACPHT